MPTDYPALHRALDIAERYGVQILSFSVSISGVPSITTRGPYLPATVADVTVGKWYSNSDGPEFRCHRGSIEGVDIVCCEYQDDDAAAVAASVPA